MNNLEFSEEQLKNNVYMLEEQTEYATFVLNTENWIQPQSEQEIIRVTSFLANVASQTLIKSQSFGKEKFNIIVYMDKFKVKSLNYKFIKYFTDIFKQLFPERLNQATIVDPPKFFLSAFEVIKNFIDKPTRKKIHFISTKENREIFCPGMEE